MLNSSGKQVSTIRKVKPTPAMAAIKKEYGNCFLVMIVPWLLRNCPSLVKRVLLNIRIIAGKAMMLVQTTKADITADSGWLGKRGPALSPRLIPNQNIKLQRRSLDNHGSFFKGMSANDRSLLCTGVQMAVVSCFAVLETSFVCVGATFCFLYEAMPNLTKSSMMITGNYWFKIYSYIVSKTALLSKRIMAFFLIFSMFCSNNCVLANTGRHYDTKQLASIISAAETKYKIPSGLLAAIAQVESGSRAFAFNVGGKAFFASSLEEAKAFANEKIKSGVRNIDIGVMQLNWRWHGGEFASLDEMLNPNSNIAYAARHLTNLYKQHGDWQTAVRYYHSSKPQHNRKYSRKVVLCWLGD